MKRCFWKGRRYGEVIVQKHEVKRKGRLITSGHHQEGSRVKRRKGWTVLTKAEWMLRENQGVARKETGQGKKKK